MKISVDYLQVYIPVFFMVLPKDLDCRWNSSKTFFNFFNPGPGQKTRKTMLDFTTLTRSSCQFFKWCKYWYEKRERKSCIHPFVQDCIIYFQKFIFRETDFWHCSNSWKSERSVKNVFFHSVVSAHVPFIVFFQGVFYSR